MQEAHEVLARIERLERDNRRLRRATALSLAALAALLGTSFAPSREDGVLRGSEIELVTPTGESYLKAFLQPNGSPMLILKKEKAHALMTLDQPALHIRDTDGRRGAFVGFDSRGFGRVELSGPDLVDGVRMSLKPDGSSGLYALDEEGYDRAAVEYTRLAEGGFGSVNVRGKQGLVRGSLSVDPTESANFVLLDGSGRTRIGTIVAPDGTPFLALEDQEGRERVRLSMEFDGAPTLDFKREDGGTIERVP